MLEELDQQSNKQRGAIVSLQNDGDYATGVLTQTRHVAKRTLLNSIRNPATTIVQVRYVHVHVLAQKQRTCKCLC